MFFLRPSGIQYVNRGDNVTIDYTLTDFIRDGNYHDLDLSGIVGVGKRIVSLRIAIETQSHANYLWLRIKGYVNAMNIVEVRTQVANVTMYVQCDVCTNEKGVIQYLFENVTWNYAHVNINGWFKV